MKYQLLIAPFLLFLVGCEDFVHLTIYRSRHLYLSPDEQQSVALRIKVEGKTTYRNKYDAEESDSASTICGGLSKKVEKCSLDPLTADSGAYGTARFELRDGAPDEYAWKYGNDYVHGTKDSPNLVFTVPLGEPGLFTSNEYFVEFIEYPNARGACVELHYAEDMTRVTGYRCVDDEKKMYCRASLFYGDGAENVKVEFYQDQICADSPWRPRPDDGEETVPPGPFE